MMRPVVLLVLLLSGGATMAQLIQSSPTDSQQKRIQQCWLDQRLGAQVPAAAAFTDSRGLPVRLGNFFNHGPVVLMLGYFSCPDLCPMAFGHVTEELNGIKPVAGQDFQVVIVSFDPTDSPARAADKKIQYVRGYKSPGDGSGWHFLVGQPAAINAVASAVGFHYSYDTAQQRYIHPTGAIILTPAGKVSHVFAGIDTSPAAMESAIHDAAAGRSTRVDDPDQQYCVNYDPTLSGGGHKVMRAIQGVSISWAVLLFGYIAFKIGGDIRHGRWSRRPTEGRP